MALESFWKSALVSGAVSLLMAAGPALSQQAPRGPAVTVYESPT
jgi:hypothetical protein